jgi:hypothetical protein
MSRGWHWPYEPSVNRLFLEPMPFLWPLAYSFLDALGHAYLAPAAVPPQWFCVEEF